jgi:hypothetical protein
LRQRSGMLGFQTMSKLGKGGAMASGHLTPAFNFEVMNALRTRWIPIGLQKTIKYTRGRFICRIPRVWRRSMPRGCGLRGKSRVSSHEDIADAYLRSRGARHDDEMKKPD